MRTTIQWEKSLQLRSKLVKSSQNNLSCFPVTVQTSYIVSF